MGTEFPTLTEKQQAVLKFVIEYIDGNGIPPAMREIAKHMGSGTRSTEVLRRLVKFGLLEKLPVPTRNTTVTKFGRDWYRQQYVTPAQGTLL